jgi:predicted ATPase
VPSSRHDAAAPAPPASSEAGLVVGRDDPLAELQRHLDTARRGVRGTVFVSGPAGIGKTALVDAFLAGVRRSGDAWIAHGQSIERYGSGEAYLPVLQALNHLATASDAPLAGWMRRHAPSWLTQLPRLVPAEQTAVPERGEHGTTRERMVREMAELLEAVSAVRPLVVVLEDLHWSDHSTLDLVAYLAERRDPARILLIGTYRPAESMRRDHPSRAMTQELLMRRRAEEVCLEPLAVEEIGQYLRARLGGRVDAALATQVHRRTEGHPLFAVTLVDWALRERVLGETHGRWALVGGAAVLDVSTPESLRQAIERQIEALDPAEQRALEAASMVGAAFSVATAAAALECETDALEERCEALVRRGQFLAAAGVEEWPDGTVAGCYRFRHALYVDVLAQRIGEARRVRMHRRVAERKEAAFGERVREIAGELAAQFSAARDPGRAVAYHALAGDNAIQRYADHEAVQHLTRGLQLLAELPEDASRREQELALLVKLSTPLMSTKGYASREVERVFERAHALSRQAAEGPHVFPLLRGLVSFYQVRGQSPTARLVGEELLARCERTGDDLARVQAHYGHGVTLYDLVEMDAAQSHLERALALYDPATHAQHVSIYGGYDPGVACRSWLALVEWLRGRPDRAFATSGAALVLGASIGHPHSLCRAHLMAATLHLFRRDPQRVREHVTVARTIADAEGFAFMTAVAGAHEGGALFFEGRLEEAATRLEEALDGFRATGAEMARPIFLGVLGVAQALTGDPERGLHLVDEALAVAEQTQQRLHLITLNRFRGQLLLAAGDPTRAEVCLRRSVTLAHQFGVKMLELQAANSLAWMWHAHGRGAEARALLAPIHASFVEGLALPDLDEARQLLNLST